MFNFRLFSRRIQDNVRRKFDESIRPVIDRSVREALERPRTPPQGGAGNNLANSQNFNIFHNLNEFFRRHQYTTGALVGTFTIVSGFMGFASSVNSQEETKNLMKEENDLRRQKIKLQQMNRANENSNQNSPGNNIRIWGDILHVINSLLNFVRNTKNSQKDGDPTNENAENVSGHRDPNDENFSTPLSGKAHRNRQQ